MSRGHQPARGVIPGPKPAWLRAARVPWREAHETAAMVDALGLHTVCREAHCPNMAECFARRTATFLIMGAVCTRGCRYCAVESGHPTLLDPDEPARVAAAVATLGLVHAVITSVTRDDLPDGGAQHYASVVAAIRAASPTTTIELLVPDFGGDLTALMTVLAARPDVLNHNIETVASLFPCVRPGAAYERSLQLLRRAADAGAVVKSGLMVGMGETCSEVDVTLHDLARAGCTIVTIGQYLPPGPASHPATRYITPAQFEEWRVAGERAGITEVFSAPLVRSSYLAEAAWKRLAEKRAARAPESHHP